MYPIKIRRLATLKQQKIHIDNEHTIYIGRGSKSLTESPLANMYRVKIYGLERCLEIYRVWIWEAIKAKHDEYEELIRILKLCRKHEVTLTCFCIDSDDPDDKVVCHGQIIRNALIYLDKHVVTY